MPVEAGLLMQYMHGEMKTYALENQKPIRGKVLFPTETIRVMGFILQHLCKATRQITMVYMILQVMYGNGALIYTTKITIKP